MKYFLKIIFFILATIIFESCVPSKPVYEEEILPADRLIKRLEANRRKIKTFIGSGVINIETPNIDAKATFEVYLKKPDSLKFIIYGPFGIDLAQALITNSEFEFYDAMKNEVYKGRNNRNVLKKIFHINLTFNEIFDAFTGSVNLTDKLRMEPDKFELFNDNYYLTYYDSLENKFSLFEILVKNLAITNYKLYQDNNLLLFEGLYSDFTMFDRVAIPYTTVIHGRIEKQKLYIDYRKIQINEDIKNLDLEIPSDVKIKFL